MSKISRSFAKDTDMFTARLPHDMLAFLKKQKNRTYYVRELIENTDEYKKFIMQKRSQDNQPKLF